MATDYISRVLKKCGRPKGSKNKKKNKRRNDTTAADEAFKEAFKDAVPTIDNINEMTDSNERQLINHDDNSEQTDTFGIDLFPVGHEEDEGYEQDVDGRAREKAAADNETDDDNIGFGFANVYNIEQFNRAGKDGFERIRIKGYN